jgi:hypothetical protein
VHQYPRLVGAIADEAFTRVAQTLTEVPESDIDVLTAAGDTGRPAATASGSSTQL